mmetsp:Transcript_16813/g.34026  ORF Transcript_16813/g.34026 Transcript_16813/m.34026 type:complete len:80 (-) Transcript_16813:242-481(-)
MGRTGCNKWHRTKNESIFFGLHHRQSVRATIKTENRRSPQPPPSNRHQAGNKTLETEGAPCRDERKFRCANRKTTMWAK